MQVRRALEYDLRKALQTLTPGEWVAFEPTPATLCETPKKIIAEQHCNAEWALTQQMNVLVEQFEDIEDAYIQAWKLGLKAVAVYRDGCKQSQPLSAAGTKTADIFRITLDPGAVITFVAELRTDKLPQLYLWEPDAYKDKVNSFTLYQGIVIGISGLLALVLTILFVVKGSVMFPAAAALAWAVLVYIGVDFGFWGKVLDMSSGAERIWRASGEAILVATLLVFLFAYLNLNRWHVRYAHITFGWLAFLAAMSAATAQSPGSRVCAALRPG